MATIPFKQPRDVAGQHSRFGKALGNVLTQTAQGFASGRQLELQEEDEKRKQASAGREAELQPFKRRGLIADVETKELATEELRRKLDEARIDRAKMPEARAAVKLEINKLFPNMGEEKSKKWDTHLKNKKDAKSLDQLSVRVASLHGMVESDSKKVGPLSDDYINTIPNLQDPAFYDETSSERLEKMLTEKKAGVWRETMLPRVQKIMTDPIIANKIAKGEIAEEDIMRRIGFDPERDGGTTFYDDALKYVKGGTQSRTEIDLNKQRLANQKEKEITRKNPGLNWAKNESNRSFKMANAARTATKFDAMMNHEAWEKTMTDIANQAPIASQDEAVRMQEDIIKDKEFTKPVAAKSMRSRLGPNPDQDEIKEFISDYGTASYGIAKPIDYLDLFPPGETPEEKGFLEKWGLDFWTERPKTTPATQRTTSGTAPPPGLIRKRAGRAPLSSFNR